jgi:hypothetical protein
MSLHDALSCEELASAPQLPINMLRQECRYDLPYTATVCQRDVRADLPNKMQVLFDESDACAAGDRGIHQFPYLIHSP